MFSAGYETASTTLRWAIAYLVHNPGCQTEILNRLDEEVGRDWMPGLDDRPSLPLVQATIMETLRLGNVAETALPHYTLKDTTLAGYRVPKHTVVVPNLMAVHMDPSCWEDPTKFNPHRHIDGDGQVVTNSVNFLPFSAGRRVCAGEALAKVIRVLKLWWGKFILYVTDIMQIISDYVCLSFLAGRIVLFPVPDIAQVYLLAPRKWCSSWP